MTAGQTKDLLDVLIRTHPINRTLYYCSYGNAIKLLLQIHENQSNDRAYSIRLLDKVIDDTNANLRINTKSSSHVAGISSEVLFHSQMLLWNL
ncbi:hypothetical protein ACTXT7_011640 [Hymenolepis weldensis]